ncbi:DUF3644 domain-containing protein [Pediococcus pentosaceus]|uniref:Uncharacterized protein n=1 Tax=Pediococcus pentosaceus TaxID=1255 RepID=A0A1Y0VVE1_PEDPE|nr:DUF3644 domain-containing protein [Pediococcus pentosaceus]ARW20653.1 hypothetical protein S100892_02118 [Pediococcus pentosaceus]UQB00832.1 DUF3644 domain-containing protein [Pediococcus pentosaceus]UQB02680.1 DUF3644 domain-containing protein [Pediococcus pentosaceus]
MENLSKRLVNKSVEAFVMGIEIYNKPTIHYRIEGFSFFIINAWELMLKAELLNRNESIYFKDDPDRTLSVNNVVNKIYTDKNTRIRINLEKIIDLRNISTHYITEDYEIKYAPLFQACVLNFIKELKKFHDIDITDYIPQNFLTLSASYSPLTNEQIKLKYPPEIAEKLIKQSNEVDVLTKEYDSDKFAINIKQNLYITKKRDKADFEVKINNSSENEVAIVKDYKDPSDTHKYSYKTVITAVNTRLDKKHIKLGYPQGFNTYVLNLFIDFYNIKQNKKYAYEHVIGNQHTFTYSQQLVDFIIAEIKKAPDKFVESLKV